VLKRLSAPFRNFFNVRFEALNGEIRQLRRVSEAGADHSELIDAVSQRVSASLDHQHDDLMSVAALLGRTIEETADGVDSLLEMSRLAETRNRSSDAAADELAQHAALDQLDDAHALVANYANAHEGWASQAGLWFNPPISVSHAEGSVTVADINERVAEIPFVYASLGVLPRGARVGGRAGEAARALPGALPGAGGLYGRLAPALVLAGSRRRSGARSGPTRRAQGDIPHSRGDRRLGRRRRQLPGRHDLRPASALERRRDGLLFERSGLAGLHDDARLRQSALAAAGA